MPREKKVQLEAEKKMMTRQLEKQFSWIYSVWKVAQSSPINFQHGEMIGSLGEEAADGGFLMHLQGCWLWKLQTKEKKGKSGDPMQMKSYLRQFNWDTGMNWLIRKKSETGPKQWFWHKTRLSITPDGHEGTKIALLTN